MENNESQNEQFSADIFNVSEESDDIEIVLDVLSQEVEIVSSGRRC